MNEKAISLLKKKKKSVYAIHQETGIAYTTLSEIFNEKININKCASETVYKLALYFGCTLEDILNPVSLLANVSGKYRGIKYKWIPQKNGTVELMIKDNDSEKIISKEETIFQERFYSLYTGMTEVMIEAYLKQKEVEEILDDTIYFDA